MSINKQQCLTIEELIAYRNGTLSGGQEAHPEGCELCKAALDGLDLIEPSMEQALLEGSFLQEFSNPSATYPAVALKKSLFPTRWIVAASIGLAIAWAAWQYHNVAEATSEFESAPLAYVEQPYRRQMRSAGITTDMYGKAAEAFTMDSFSTSIKLYQEAIPKAPTELLRTRGYYEIGIAYWKAGAFEEATDFLTRARLGELDYYEDATWALAQLYRQTGFLDEAKSLYNDLKEIQKSPYYPKAEQMIDMINKAESPRKE